MYQYMWTNDLFCLQAHCLSKRYPKKLVSSTTQYMYMYTHDPLNA